MGLLCYKHSWLTFPALEIDKIFLIFIKRYFCCTIISLLTILVRSSWLDMSLVLFFFRFCDFVSVTSRLVNNAYFYDTYIEMVPRKSTCHVIDVVGAKTRWPKSHEKDFCQFSTQTAEKLFHFLVTYVPQMKNIVIVETLRGYSNFHIVEINIHCLKTQHLQTLRVIQ